MYLNILLKWPDDGRLRPKHVVKYNLTVITTSCLDVCCVLTVILYNTNVIIHNGMPPPPPSLSLKKKVTNSASERDVNM